LIQSTVEFTTTAPPSASHGVFSGQLAKHAGRVRVPPLRYSRELQASPPRLDIHSDCLHAGVTIEYFTRFVRLPNEPDRARQRGNQRPRHTHGLGVARTRKTPPAVAE